MADYTQQPLAKIEEDTDRDRWGGCIKEQHGFTGHL
jgi:hypothetical protein